MGTAEGLDIDWFAVDGDGHVAHFTTAGSGWVPAQVLEEDYRDDVFLDYLRGTTRTTEFVQDRPCDFNIADTEFGLAAEHGLYTYDWLGLYKGDGPYSRLARPKVAIRDDDLPEGIRAIACRVRFTSICFAESSLLSPEKYLPCIK